MFESKEGYKYFLCVCDVFNQMIYCRSLKRKTAEAVRDAFKSIFEESKITPVKLQTDAGTEFKV